MGKPKQEIQAFLRSTLEQMHEGIQVVDANWKYIYVNDAAAKHGRTSKESLLGRTLMECYPGIDQSELFQTLNEVMQDQKPRSLENLFIYPDGDKTWFDIFIEPHTEGILIRSIDITDRKVLQESYMHAQKMESIGQLAGGVAHDFNNKLATMSLYCEMISDSLPEQPLKAKEYAKNIQKAIEQSTQLTRQLLAFSRKQVLDLKTINLNELVNTLNSEFMRFLGEHVIVETHLQDDLGAVRIDPGQIEQVILNLCINARDAMPNGGVITIETRNTILDEDYCNRRSDVTPGEYVLISVTDNGVGMSKEIQKRAFEPFFTTKSVGKGTGLGLSMVHGVVKQSRGHIWLYSEEGIGTTFKMYFPQFGQTQSKEAPAPASTEALTGSECILLVEDDPMLRSAFESTLSRVGYKVLTAESGHQALQIFAENDIDLLLTDLVMPKMTGKELADELRTIRSDLKVIFVSGYTKNSIVHNAALDIDSVLIQKPVRTQDLLRTIQEVLKGNLTKGVV